MRHRRRPTGRRVATVALAGALVLAVAPACSDDGDSEAFCERIGSMPDVAEVLGSLDTSDPGGVERGVQEALDEFRSLESDAPGQIRSDIARLRQGVQLVLDAVKDNPGDLPGARQDILARSDELAGLVQAGADVAAYTQEECSITLE